MLPLKTPSWGLDVSGPSLNHDKREKETTNTTDDTWTVDRLIKTVAAERQWEPKSHMDGRKS